VETNTQFFFNTLESLSRAWYEAAAAAGLPAAGATGVANGLGQFTLFTHSPSEGNPPQQDAMVLIPPAAGMLAGSVGGTAARDNLFDAVASLQGAALFDPKYGVPNYQDFGSGLVDMSDPVYGTLEIAQMAASLLNRIMQGGTLQFYLTQDPQFNGAILAYFSQMNSREAEFQPTGDGMEVVRTAAGSDAAWNLAAAGDMVEYEVNFTFAANLSLILRYSNVVPGDALTVLVNGVPLGGPPLILMDTGGTNVFVNSPAIPLGVQTGSVMIGFRLEVTEGSGVDLDRFRIGFDQPGGEGEAEGEAETFGLDPSAWRAVAAAAASIPRAERKPDDAPTASPYSFTPAAASDAAFADEENLSESWLRRADSYFADDDGPFVGPDTTDLSGDFAD
jgi:hypothetical protein